MDWGAAVRGVEALAARAHPLAVDAALSIVAFCVGLAALLALNLAARKLFGVGATPAEVEELIERTVAGELAEIKDLIKALDHKVDGHGEQIAFLDGRLQSCTADGRERRQPGSRRRQSQ